MSYTDQYLDGPGTPFVTIGDDGARWAEQNKGVTPLFYREPVQNPEKTAREGRPIFDQEERVRIVVAADQFNQVVHPVTEEIKARFPDAYRRWKESNEDKHIEGTPLRAWALLNSAQVAEFEALNIFNVEGLATVAETNINRHQALRAWRDKALAWLASAKDGATAVRLTEENKVLSDDVAALKAQVEKLASQLQAQSKEA